MKRSPRGPRVVLDTERESLVTHSGALLIEETINIASLSVGLSAALAPWRRLRATHDPGKVVVDLAVAVALGGDCAADLAAVRAQPDLFGPAASDPTVSRLFTALTADAAETDAVLTAIRAARAAARNGSGPGGGRWPVRPGAATAGR